MSKFTIVLYLMAEHRRYFCLPGDLKELFGAHMSQRGQNNKKCRIVFTLQVTIATNDVVESMKGLI